MGSSPISGTKLELNPLSAMEVAMKEFLKALLYAFIVQTICWGIFTLCDEFSPIQSSNPEFLVLVIIGLISTAIILTLYFIFVKRIIKKYKLNFIRFNLFLVSLWIIMSLVNAFLFFAVLVSEKRILHYCHSSGWDCFLNGIEYGFYGLWLAAIALPVIIWLIASGIYKIIKRKTAIKS